MSRKKEIEMKFLPDGMPADLREIGKCIEWQGYISIEPELRIRKRLNLYDGSVTYFQTLKDRSNVLGISDEDEIIISKQMLYALRTLIPKEIQLITKFKRTFLLDNFEYECSQIDPGYDNSYFYSEIEFNHMDEYGSYVLPEWLIGKEAPSGNYKSSMAKYWKNTRLLR